MFEHLRFQGDTVAPRTAAGIFTNELLDLNDPGVIQFRAYVARQLDVQRSKLRELNSAVSLVRSKLAAGRVAAGDAEIDLRSLDDMTRIVESDISRLLGTLPIT